jgi:hypothetical protein
MHRQWARTTIRAFSFSLPFFSPQGTFDELLAKARLQRKVYFSAFSFTPGLPCTIFPFPLSDGTSPVASEFANVEVSNVA